MDEYRKWADVPANLMTETQLRKAGLRPAKGQGAAARYVGGYGPYPLYDRDLAVPKRKPSEAQLTALAEARRKAMTTTCCNRYVGTINWREKDDMCPRCWYAEQERRHEARLKRYRDEASEWARGVLADPAAVILDTETTGLDGSIVEIAIINVAGEVLLDQLVYPGCPIPASATAIHHITDEMVLDAPGFSAVYEDIRRIVSQASRVIIYNEAFDVARLRYDARRCALPVLEFKSECAMEAYAEWYGEWSDYHKSFKWQRLTGGGHRALGDCLATLERIKTMASDDNEH